MRSSCRLASILGVFALASGLSVGAAGLLVRAAAAQGHLTRITVDIEEMSLVAALETVAGLGGQDLDVVGATNLANDVSLSLRNVTVQEGLEKILQTENYVILWLQGNRVKVLLLDDEHGLTPELADRGARAGEPPLDASATPLDTEEELLPPPGEPAFGATELSGVQRVYPSVDPSELDVVPPGLDEQRGFTQADIEFSSASQPNLEPHEIELFPPDNDDAPTLTLDDFQSMKSTWLSLTPAQAEIIPPDLPGEPGITLEQLETIRPSADFQPAAADLLPPDEVP